MADLQGDLPHGAPISAGALCLFCRIVSGDIPATIVHESAAALAFRDLHPTAPTHVLVIPKRHISHAGTIEVEDGALVAEMFAMAQHVAAAEGLSERGYRLVFNVGSDSGMSVPHLHMHLIGGRRLGWPPFADG